MDRLRRGDIVIVAIQGDYGKARPAVVIQADEFKATETVVVLPLTSHLDNALAVRLPVEPTPENRLKSESRIMIDKPAVVRREKLSGPVGRVSAEVLLEVNRALLVFLGLA